MTTALLTVLGIFFVGMLIPQLLARSVIGPFFRLFVVPGVILHELAHAFFCLMTGAKIRRIRLFKREGGEVAHEQAKIPILGPLLITLAPLLIGLFAIIVIGKKIVPNVGSIPVGTTLQDFPVFFSSIVRSVSWNDTATWVALYLILSIGATLAPSIQDLKNSWFPLVLLMGVFGVTLRSGVFDAYAAASMPALTLALFILIIIAVLAGVIYTLSSFFGINR